MDKNASKISTIGECNVTPHFTTPTSPRTPQQLQAKQDQLSQGATPFIPPTRAGFEIEPKAYLKRQKAKAQVTNYKDLRQYYKMPAYSPTQHVTQNNKKKNAQNPKVSHIAIPRWIANMVPKKEICTIFTAAALVGAQSDPLLLQQPNIHLGTKTFYRFVPWFTDEEIDILWDYGEATSITRFSVLVRTCIVLGLGLAGRYTGKVLPSVHRPPFSMEEWTTILRKGGIVPKYPSLIAEEHIHAMKINIEQDSDEFKHRFQCDPAPAPSMEVAHG